MHIKKILQNFLYDQEYFISLFQNSLHIYNYEELLILSETYIEIKLDKFIICIDGLNLTIVSMDKRELLIKGTINNLRLKR